jgi:hypothetical protein
MGMSYEQVHLAYRVRKNQEKGFDNTRCGKVSKYEIDGRKLCAFHAGIAAIEILLRDDRSRVNDAAYAKENSKTPLNAPEDDREQ